MTLFFANGLFGLKRNYLILNHPNPLPLAGQEMLNFVANQINF